MRDGPIIAMLVVALLCYCCGRKSEADERPPLESRVRTVLDGMPRSKFDRETDDEQSRRLDELARVISEASRNDTDAAILLTLGQHESHFAAYVGAGCEDIPDGASDCDGGRARSYWQAWAVACPKAWALPRGSSDATEAFARCAVRRYRGALKRCQGRHEAGYWAGGFSGYRGASCSWGPAAARARTLEMRLGQLR